MGELREPEDIRRVLEAARTVAVLGVHTNTAKPAHYVPDYLHEVGYHILPVNPVFVGRVMWGEPVRRTLAELEEPVDLVDVFRRGEAIPQHLDDILAMQPLPKVVWFQAGIRNDAAARQLVEAGIDVVQSRCTYADHRNFGIPPR